MGPRAERTRYRCWRVSSIAIDRTALAEYAVSRGPPCTDARRRPVFAGSAAAYGASRARFVDEAARVPGVLSGVHLPDRGRGAGTVAAHPGGAGPPARCHDRRAGGPSRRGDDPPGPHRSGRDGRTHGGGRRIRDARGARRRGPGLRRHARPQPGDRGPGAAGHRPARGRAGRQPLRAGTRARADRDRASASRPVRVAGAGVRRRRRPLPSDLGAASRLRGDAQAAGRRPRRDPVRGLPGQRIHGSGPVRRCRGRSGGRPRGRGVDLRPDRTHPPCLGDGAHLRRAGPAAAGGAVHGRGRRPARSDRTLRCCWDARTPSWAASSSTSAGRPRPTPIWSGQASSCATRGRRRSWRR